MNESFKPGKNFTPQCQQSHAVYTVTVTVVIERLKAQIGHVQGCQLEVQALALKVTVLSIGNDWSGILSSEILAEPGFDCFNTFTNEFVSRVLGSEDQESLAVVVCQMWLYRSVLLGLSPDHTSVPLQPEGYVPSDDTLDAVAPSP
jgi:hypothetical protein